MILNFRRLSCNIDLEVVEPVQMSELNVQQQPVNVIESIDLPPKYPGQPPDDRPPTYEEALKPPTHN